MNTQSKLLLSLSLVIFMYIGIAFLAPISLKFGWNTLGNAIYSTYERFCHQRVERSLFIFGEKSFYSVFELKDDGAIPQVSNSNQYPEYFGHGFNGDEKVGFKVAVCIRDIALYLSFAFTCLMLAVKKRVSDNQILPILLILPIFLDVVIQWIIEFQRLDGPYLLFENNLAKRIVTGIFAGIGCALIVKIALQKSLTNQEKIGNI